MTVLMTPAELDAAMTSGGIVVIDTRNPAAYAEGHIPGAFNLHDIFTYLATSTPEGMAELRGKFADAFGALGLSGAETAVFYEGSMNSGFGQSCRGYFLLQYLGYKNAKILHGGLAAWTAAGMPLATEAATPTPAAFPVTDAGKGLILTKDDILAALDDKSIALLDVRDVDEWVGESSSPYGKDFCPRKGRLPGARWIEWYRMMKPTAAGPMLKSKNEILAECATVGITPASKVYIYCFKGARASNSYVALAEAGITNTAIYFGSWNEWSRDPSLPIEEGLPFGTAELAVAAE
ncbi:sulfurtransferase [Acidiphilium sp. PA]|uniref:sulfurtransferase n=1 Tax=Acidiphilium sp. PA TaxID=2871705 RepID=UPI0022446AEF|nr:sulfurtransferase [Acidiphilium sp. PA]MCW8305825.1 sulfurtransferase [Acidiphilium sp. PA]